MSEDDKVSCPKCGQSLSLAMVAHLKAESRMTFELTPETGELFSARNVGGAIEQMDRLLTAIGKDAGTKTSVLVESISSENGAIKVHLLIARHEPGIKKASAA